MARLFKIDLGASKETLGGRRTQSQLPPSIPIRFNLPQPRQMRRLGGYV